MFRLFRQGQISSNKALIFQMNSSEIPGVEHISAVSFDKNTLLFGTFLFSLPTIRKGHWRVR